MRKNEKKCNSLFFFSQLVGCDFQVEHREKPRLKNECFIYKENVSLLLNVLTVTTSRVLCGRGGEWGGDAGLTHLWPRRIEPGGLRVL